jgi:hypothetical protein
MAGNLNIAKISSNRDLDIRQVINRRLKGVVETNGYFTGWIDGEGNLNEFLQEYEVAESTSFKLCSSATQRDMEMKVQN